jgi:hypothetical protein
MWPMSTVPDVANTPREVPFAEVGDFDQLDERVSAVKVIFGSVVGVNDGYIEWCPDDVTPSEQERLAWIWLCSPSLDGEILPRADGWFRDLIVAYRAGEMRRWWDEAGRPAVEEDR